MMAIEAIPRTVTVISNHRGHFFMRLMGEPYD